MDNLSGGGIQSVERALNILKLFKQDEEIGITEIGRKLNLSKGTVHGLVKTLERNGFLEKNPETRRYRCGVEAFKLGMSIAVRMDIRRISSDRARKLCDEVQETVHLTVLMDGMCVNIDQFSPVRQFMLIPQVGSVVPAHCTPREKFYCRNSVKNSCRLSLNAMVCPVIPVYTVTDTSELYRQLQEVRERGYAVSNQEALLGLSCIGAPIKDYSGSVAAAISVAGSTESVMEPERHQEIIDAVLKAAGDISSDLGYERSGN